MHSYVLYNDKIFPSSEKILLPGQIGLLSGWGIFTTLRVYEGVPFAFERHWQRMSRDAKLLHVELRHNPYDVRRGLLQLVEANQAREATMRLCVVRSEGGDWAGPGSGRASDLIALTKDLNQWKESVSLDVADHARYAASPFAGTKTLSWAHNLTLAETAREKGFDEVILLNEGGEVSECTSANLFAAKDGAVYTPPLSSGALPGVTRAVMLEELNSKSSPVVEKVLRLEDLYEADEVFITSTTRELLPVDRILDRRIAKGGPYPWPLMEALQSVLTAYIRHYVENAKRATLSPGRPA